MKAKKNEEIFIRSDGWVFSKEGMERLKQGGYKGFARFKASMESQLGKWHRVSKPLDKEAADALKAVKGFVARGKFLSSAILAEAARRAKEQVPQKDIPPKGREEKGQFMRLTLTDDAYWTVRPFENRVFREFVSEAILRAAKKQK